MDEKKQARADYLRNVLTPTQRQWAEKIRDGAVVEWPFGGWTHRNRRIDVRIECALLKSGLFCVFRKKPKRFVSERIVHVDSERLPAPFELKRFCWTTETDASIAVTCLACGCLLKDFTEVVSAVVVSDGQFVCEKCRKVPKSAENIPGLRA